MHRKAPSPLVREGRLFHASGPASSPAHDGVELGFRHLAAGQRSSLRLVPFLCAALAILLARHSRSWARGLTSINDAPGSVRYCGVGSIPSRQRSTNVDPSASRSIDSSSRRRSPASSRSIRDALRRRKTDRRVIAEHPRAIMVMASTWVGLTCRHIDEPGSFSGSFSSAKPRAGRSPSAGVAGICRARRQCVDRACATQSRHARPAPRIYWRGDEGRPSARRYWRDLSANPIVVLRPVPTAVRLRQRQKIGQNFFQPRGVTCLRGIAGNSWPASPASRPANGAADFTFCRRPSPWRPKPHAAGAPTAVACLERQRPAM